MPGLILRNCVQIRMYPYSFSEFLEQEREEEPGLSRDACFERFFRLGSMPGIRLFHHEEEAVHQYLLDVCKAAMLQDAVRENNLRGIGQLWMMLGSSGRNLGTAGICQDHFRWNEPDRKADQQGYRVWHVKSTGKRPYHLPGKAV